MKTHLIPIVFIKHLENDTEQSEKSFSAKWDFFMFIIVQELFFNTSNCQSSCKHS